ncbi:MAG: hypothetical protein Kow0059_00520 [Candidatus Sumerlaeia bacterium]
MIARRFCALTLVALSAAAVPAGCGIAGGVKADGAPEPIVVTDRSAGRTPELPPSSGAAVNPLEDNVGLAVEGQIITIEELQRDWVHRHARSGAAQPSAEPPPEDLQSYIDDQLGQLILVKAARDARADKETEFQQILRPHFRSLLVEFFKQRYLFSDITVTDDEIAAYYEARRKEFEKPPTVSVRFILTATREDAMEALQLLREGKPFEEVARTRSIHQSAVTGGALPPFSAGTYDPDFERVAFSLPVGGMSGVVHTAIGYCIIEKTGETQARVEPLDSVREEIRARLLREKHERRLREYLDAKRRQYNVYVNPRLFDLLSGPPPAVEPSPVAP